MTPKELKQRNNRFILYICLLILASAGHFWSGYNLGRLMEEKEWEKRIKKEIHITEMNSDSKDTNSK